MKFNQGANSREHKKSPENIYIIPTIRLFYSVIKNNRKVSKKEKRRKAKLEEKKRLCNSDLQNMALVSRNTEPGLIIDLKDWESTEVRAQISVPDTGLQPQHLSLFIPQMKHQTQKRLTEIFGGTPWSGLALAQGEAALSAQEAPHPCPACRRARSSQPPSFTSWPEVGAAEECPQTPSCCFSPGINSPK